MFTLNISINETAVISKVTKSDHFYLDKLVYVHDFSVVLGC